MVHSSQVDFFFPWALGIEVCTSCPSAQFHCQREELLEEETKMGEQRVSKALRFKLTIGAISRQRECSVGTQDSRQSMLNSSQRANAAKHRIRPAPPTQTQVSLLLNQLPIVFFVTLKNPKNSAIWSHFKVRQPGFHTFDS